MNKTQEQTVLFLKQLLAKYPTMRVGQIIASGVEEVTIGERDSSLYYISDDELLRGLINWHIKAEE